MDEDLESLKRRYDADPENLDLLYAYDRALERLGRTFSGRPLREWLDLLITDDCFASKGQEVLLDYLPYSFPALYDWCSALDGEESRRAFALMLNHRNREKIFPIVAQMYEDFPEPIRELCSSWIVVHARENPSPGFLALVPRLRELTESADIREASAALLTLSRWGFGEEYRSQFLEGAHSDHPFQANHCFRALAYIAPDQDSLDVLERWSESDPMLARWHIEKWHSFLNEDQLGAVSELFLKPNSPSLPFLLSFLLQSASWAEHYQESLWLCLSEDGPWAIQRDALKTLLVHGLDGPTLEEHYARLELSGVDEARLHLERTLREMREEVVSFHVPLLGALSLESTHTVIEACRLLIYLGCDDAQLYAKIEDILSDKSLERRTRVVDALHLLPSEFMKSRKDLFKEWIDAEPCGPGFFSFMKCFQVGADEKRELLGLLSTLAMKKRVDASLVTWIFALSTLSTDTKTLQRLQESYGGCSGEIDRAFADGLRRVQLKSESS